MDGQGRLRYVDGDMYEGEWTQGRRNGMGIYCSQNCDKFYEGEWLDDT